MTDRLFCKKFEKCTKHDKERARLGMRSEMLRKRQQGLRLLRQLCRSLLAASAVAILSLDLARKVSGTWICRMQLPFNPHPRLFNRAWLP